MTARPVKTVVSPLLSVPPPADAPVRERAAVDLEYQQSIDEEFTESYEAYCRRRFGTAS